MGRKIIALVIIAVAVGGLAGYFLLTAFTPHVGPKSPSWKIVNYKLATPYARQSIHAFDSQNVWILGSDGVWWWNGENFSLIAKKPTIYPAWAFYVLSPNEIWLGDPYLWRWDGSKWSKFVPFERRLVDNVFMYGFVSWIHMLSTTDGWAAVNLYDTALGLGQHVGVCFLRWNGENWSELLRLGSKWISSIDMISKDEGWAVGDNGTILHWNGQEWSPVPSPTSEALIGIDMISKNEGWAVGDNGTILHWNGQEWSPVPSPTSSPIMDIEMLSSSEGWAISMEGLLKYGWGKTNG
ncbi:MAG: hypothetical protein QW356_07315 [Candidatus Hadarchaeales archaeon]